jgi:outer membrane receptor protein involved in Fe transport
VLLLLAMCLTPTLARAQNSITGELKGTVMDTSQAVVPGVTVTISNVETGVVTPTTTNNNGLYDVPFLIPDDYTITFSKQGFRDFVRQGVKLEIETLEIDATLQVGTATQEVVVTSAAPLVETETTEQHVDLDTKAVEAAPIAGVDWRSSLVQLTPGINTGGGAGEATSQAIGVNGTQGYNVNFMIDGSAATSVRDYNSSNNYMPVDSISEVSINSGNAGPQYGNGLAMINAVTKSGTNTWHGSGFEYVQNTILDARGFYDETGPKSTTHYNLFGGTVGGPILKNKLFFFFTYQKTPSSGPVQGFYSYPTAAMEAGDFYGIPGATNATYFNPATGALLGSKDAVAAKLQSYFPAATAAGWAAGCPGPVNVGPTVAQTCTETDDFNYHGSAPNTSTWYEGKVDYNISSKQKVSFSFNYYPNFVTYVPADPLYPSDASTINQAHNYNLTGQFSDVYTISPTVLNEFRAGAQRELDSYAEWSLGKNDPTSLGLEPTYGTNVPANVFPNITISSGAGLGESTLGGSINAILGEGTYNFSDIVTLIHGRHTIKIGGEYDRTYQDYTGWGNISSGQFTFSGSVTGIPYADFLAGDVSTWNVYDDDATSARAWTSAVFANDDFKVSSHVTLNMGLRWQIASGWGATGDLFGDYDPNVPNSQAYVCSPGATTTAGCSLDLGAKGAVLYGGASDTAYGGSDSNYNSVEKTNYREFAPRIGIAWSPSQNWSIRASYGVFDAPRPAESFSDGALGLGFNPAGYMSGSPAFKLATGPAPNSVTYPTLSTLSPEVANYTGGVVYYPQNMPTQFVSEWLLDIQHEFAGGVLVDAGYFYTRGTNLGFGTDIDQAPVSQLGQVCTPIYPQVRPGYYPNVNANCAGPVPWFGSIVAQTYDGWSNYNALQIRLQKRMTYGLSFLVNESWSKSLDTGTGNGHGQGIDIYQNAYSPLANYGLSDFNAANTLTGQITWEVPYGSGRQHALHGAMDEIVGGWRVSSVFEFHTGIPFTPVIQGSVAAGSAGCSYNPANGGTCLDPALYSSLNAYDFNNGEVSTLLPNETCNGNMSNPTITKWFNTSCFVNPAPGTFGNTGRNTLIGPGFADVDFSVAKDFPLHFREGMSLQVRADITNLFNHPNFANPNASVGESNFGTITSVEDTNFSTYAPNRVVQLGAHFTF